VEIKERQGMDTMEVASWVASVANRMKADEVYVDEIGIGSGVLDRLEQLELRSEVIGVDVRGTAYENELFDNRRAEIYWQVRESVERQEVSLPENEDKLLAELSAIRFDYSKRGKIIIEQKKETRKRVGRSPDLADATVIGFQEEAGAGFYFGVAG
jgi:hypothetical protein